MRILQRKFYNRNSLDVAPELLGKILVRNFENSFISGRIVEVEAYLPFIDEAAHSFKGQTKRNRSLFGPPGTAYVYSIHMQNCLDVVTDELGIPGSVLIRALEPLGGIDLMRQFRNKESLKDLTSGPGKLCKALNISRSLDGIDLTKKNTELFIVEDDYLVPNIKATKRIGISKAKDFDYRFYIENNPYISKK